MKKLRLLLTLVFILSIGFASFSSAEEEPPVPEGYKRAYPKISLFKKVKDLTSYRTVGESPQKLFYADGNWFDSQWFDKTKFKNFDEDIIALPVKSKTHQGIYVKRDGMTIKVDTNGDGKPDETVAKSGTIVNVKITYPFPERKETVALAFFNELDAWTNNPHWTVQPAYCWTAKIGGAKVFFFDNDLDGMLYVQTNDGMIVEDCVVDKVFYGSYLSSIALIKGKLYSLIFDDQVRWIDFAPYKGDEVKADFVSKFSGPEKPKFVVLRSYFDKPDPNAISIFLPKGKGVVPPASYELKWTMLTEKCFGADKSREGQWYDETIMPYQLSKKGEKVYFPTYKPRHDVRDSSKPWEKKNQLDMNAEDKKFVYEWGEPFCIHLKPFHKDEDDGAKVDRIVFEAWNFVFYDSSGVCFYTPKEYETDGAALPEELMFNILITAPSTGKLLTKNTRYTKGSGGGDSDASPDWASFEIDIKGERGVFKIQVQTKSKVFGQIDHFLDYKFVDEKKVEEKKDEEKKDEEKK